MTRRAPVDWDELEIALTMDSDELRNYLNLRSGKVEIAANDLTGDGLPEEEVETGFAEGYLIAVEPISSQAEYRWMADFAETVADRRLPDMLELALDGRGAFGRFKRVLSDHPAERERWFAFHQERLDEAMKHWLSDNDIEPTTPFPQRRGRG
jgi:hypothetical protein